MTTENQIVVAQSETNITEAFTNTASVFFSSIVDDGSRGSKVKIYNAMQDAVSLADYEKEVIEVTDILAHTIELEDEQSGELVKTTRVVLVGTDGTAYAAISKGIMSSVQKIVAIVGQAPWEPAIKVMPISKKTRNGFKTLTLSMVVEEEAAEVKKK